jgi:hypothetical protein
MSNALGQALISAAQAIQAAQKAASAPEFTSTAYGNTQEGFVQAWVQAMAFIAAHNAADFTSLWESALLPMATQFMANTLEGK